MLHDFENRIKDSTKSVYTEDGTKPVVHYVGKALFIDDDCAKVVVIDHPAFVHGDTIRTSKIVKVHDNGDIETMNTIYRQFKE